jgi:hypothetical protein
MSPVSDGVAGFDEQAKAGFHRIRGKFRIRLVAWIGRKLPVADTHHWPAEVTEVARANGSSRLAAVVQIFRANVSGHRNLPLGAGGEGDPLRPVSSHSSTVLWTSGLAGKDGRGQRQLPSPANWRYRPIAVIGLARLGTRNLPFERSEGRFNAHQG